MVEYKKNILAILFLCLCSIATGTTYYVSSAGNDAANGLSEATSWNSITKVNSVFSTLNPGDMVLFKRGDTFYGSLTVTSAGTSGNPIIIGAYGTGNNPVISGFVTLTEWTNYGGGIYSRVVSTQSRPNILLLDGVNTPLGTTPDMPEVGWPSNFATGDTYTQTSMYDAALSDSPNMAGADIIIRTQYWVNERRTVNTHSGGTVTFNGTDYPIRSGHGYFFQNHISTLNRYGEWCYSGGTVYMYFGAENPASHTVKVSTLDNIVTSTKGYVTLDGLTIEGGNAYNIKLDGGNYNVVKNCTVQFGGNHGVFGANSSNLTIQSNIISNNNSFGVYMGEKNCPSSSITYNTITNTGYLIGMGCASSGYWNSNTSYSAITSSNNYTVISYNNIHNTGYDGISFGGIDAQITYNYITYAGLNKADGGAIYCYRGGDASTGKVIDHNIILHIPTVVNGLADSPLIDGANAIYLDGAHYTKVTNNTVGFVEGKGIFINSNHNNTVENNTFFDCLHGIFVMSEPDRTAEPNGQDGHARNHIIRYNTSVSNISTSNQEVLRLVTQNDESDISQFGTIDNNYYASPSRSDDYILAWNRAWNWDPPSVYTKAINISELRSMYGHDINSTMFSTAIPDVKRIRFEYNATNANKIITLDAGYTDVRGTKFSGSITLLPYTSIILMPDANTSAAPTIPSYVSSAIQNATPNTLEITYNLNLAIIVPSSSAFNVSVNTITRTVNTVSVSGTKVLLTLASPVRNGDVVTFSYTKPASNPIQTSSGGQAATLSAQAVTNNVLPAAPPVYVSSAIENATPSTLEMTYNLGLANIVPAASAFSVTVNSLPRSVNTVSISGTKVLLTLANPVIYGDIVTVGYTKSATNPLQTPSAGFAITISAQPVTNRVSNPATLGYINSAIGNGTPTLLEINYNLTLASILPAASAFSVRVNSVTRNVNSVAIKGNSVVLTLASEVLYGDVVTVAYTKPATNPLQSTSGLQAATMSAQSVTNKIDPAGPVYIKSTVENITPGIIEITYNENLDPAVPDVSSFVVMVNGVRREITSISISGNKVRLTLASPVVFGDVITVSYIKPASNQLKKATGETAVSFSSPQPVKNNLIRKGNISIYPNPAREFINISIMEESLESQILRIFDLSGKLCFENQLNPGTNNRVLIDIKSGIYVVQILSGSVINFVQKLIVVD